MVSLLVIHWIHGDYKDFSNMLKVEAVQSPLQPGVNIPAWSKCPSFNRNEHLMDTYSAFVIRDSGC